MVLGNSMCATVFAVYRKLNDSNETIRVPWLNDSTYFDGLEDEYEFIELQEEPYINDEWNKSIDFKSDDIKLLIECDYCRKHFTITQKNRDVKISSYKSTLRKGDFDLECVVSDLYKDNCKKCQSKKSKETMFLVHGFTNQFQTPQARQNWMKSFKEVNLVKTSRGQRYLADMFNAELNVPVGYYFADMILDNKIVIEYDGGGHNYRVKIGEISQEEFDILERRREQELINKGYKILRFVSESEYFPEESVTKSIISEAIANLYLTDQNVITLTMGNKVNDPVYGKLYPIKRILEKSEFGGDKNEN